MGDIEVKLTEDDIEALLKILKTERTQVLDHPGISARNKRSQEHELNNLMNKLSLTLAKARFQKS